MFIDTLYEFRLKYIFVQQHKKIETILKLSIRCNRDIEIFFTMKYSHCAVTILVFHIRYHTSSISIYMIHIMFLYVTMVRGITVANAPMFSKIIFSKTLYFSKPK
jgi:hypothetical protein